MENNGLKTKLNKKKIVILLTSLFVALGLGIAGIVVWNTVQKNAVVDNTKDNDDATNYGTDPAITLDENGMPEDGSDIVEIKTAEDEETLRKLLLADGKYAIELTKDIRISKMFEVRGTKKLVGNKTIIMELYAETNQSILSVLKGANLIIDGVTLDGNGIANGVIVAQGAGFTGKSGTILYPVPYGVLVGGAARITDMTIDHSMDIGVCVQEGASVSIEGGKITDSAQTGVHIQASATAKISNDVLIEGTHYCVRNRGICVVTGGTLQNASGYLVYNTGELDIDYKGTNANDKLVWSNADGEAGIRIGAGGITTISGLHLRDMQENGIRAVNHGSLNISNSIIENTQNYGIASVNGKNTDTIVDVEVRNTGASAVRARSTKKVNIENLTVKDTTGFGIKNENTLVVAKNVTVINSKNTGIWGDVTSTTEVDGATITGSGKFGVANNSATMKLKNIKIENPARMGIVAKKQSVTELSNITITGAPERGIYNLGGELNAKNVTVTDTGVYAVSTAKSGGYAGKVVITNLTVTGVKQKDAVNCYESVLEVTSATLSNAKRHGAIASKGGKLKLTDVKISNCGERGVIGSGGDVTLKNVVVKKTEKFGVTVNKTKEYKGSLTAENLTITDVKGNALNNNGSVMKVTGVQISDIKGNGVYVEDSATLTLANADLENCQKRGVYVDSASKVTLTDTTIAKAAQSSIFQNPGTQVDANDVIVKSSGSYGIFVSSAKLNASSVSIIGTGNNGLHIKSTDADGQSVVTVDGLTVTNAGKRGVQNVGGKVTLAKVIITKPGAIGASTSKTGKLVGELNITDLTVKEVKAEEDGENNALNCNASVLTITGGNISDISGNGAYVEHGGQMTLNNVTMKDCAKRGVYANSAEETGQSVVEGNVLVLENIGQRGIENKGSKINLEDVTITKPGTYGASTSKSDDRKFAGELALKNLTIKEVQKNNALNCNGSVLKVTTATITTVKQNGVYVENAGQLTLNNVEIAGCSRRGIYANGEGTIATFEDVNISDTVMTNLRVKNAKLTATDLVVTMNDQIGKTVDDELFYGIWMEGDKAEVTIGGAKSTVTRTAEETPDNSAIWVEKGTLTIDGGVYSGLQAPKGSVLYNNGGSIVVNNGKFENNKASAHGGVIFAEKGSVTINNGTFKNNEAADRGGVILSKKTVTINGGEFANNEAKGTLGGGVIGCTSSATLNIAGGSFHDNKASSNAETDDVYGGGVIESAGNVVISGGTFEKNEAQKGGVIYMDKAGSLNITAGTFGSENKGNVASYQGGAIYIAKRDSEPKNANATIQGATFAHNKAANSGAVAGGAICVSDNSKIAISNCTFSNNKAEYTGTKSETYLLGGAIRITDSSVSIANTTFASNQANIGGAILISSAGNLSLNSCNFDNNVANSSSIDIRCNDTSTLELTGEISAEVGLNNTAKILVNNALDDNSAVTIRIVNGSSISGSKKRDVVVFANAELMNQCESKSNFGLHSTHSSKKLSFADNKATIVSK